MGTTHVTIDGNEAAAGIAYQVGACNSTAFCEVRIDHPNSGGYSTHYLHLSIRIADATPVVSGQKIGVSGDTGAPGQPHLHFEVRVNGIPVDPYGWTGTGNDPYTRAANRALW